MVHTTLKNQTQVTDTELYLLYYCIWLITIDWKSYPSMTVRQSKLPALLLNFTYLQISYRMILLGLLINKAISTVASKASLATYKNSISVSFFSAKVVGSCFCFNSGTLMICRVILPYTCSFLKTSVWLYISITSLSLKVCPLSAPIGWSMYW